MSTPIVGSDAYTASFNVPEDLIDGLYVSSVNPAFQALANRTTYLKGRMDAVETWDYRPVKTVSWAYADDSDNETWFQRDNPSGEGFGFETTGGTSPTLVVNDLQVGDTVHLHMHTTVRCSWNEPTIRNPGMAIRLVYQYTLEPGSYIAIPHARVYFAPEDDMNCSVSLHGIYTHSHATYTSIGIRVQGHSLDSASTLRLISPVLISGIQLTNRDIFA